MADPAVWKDAFLDVDGTNLSGYVRSLALDIEYDAVEYTAMGNSFHVNLSGLGNWACEVELNQATSVVDSILSPLTGGTSARVLTIRQTSQVTATTNMQYAGSAIITAYRPYGGEVGSMTIATASFAPAGALAETTA